MDLKKTYQKIFYATVGCALLILSFFFYQPPLLLGIICFGLIISLCLIVFFLILKVIQVLPGYVPLRSFLFGTFIVIGGACFDVAATITYSPDLALEANPFIQFFITFGLSLKQLYFIGILGQILYVAVISALWASFLKAYPILIKSIQPCGIISIIIKMYGGINATKRDLLLNRVDYFYHINSIIPIVVASSLYRWYLALEWLGWVPISRVFVPVIIFLFAGAGYIFYSYRQINFHQSAYP